MKMHFVEMAEYNSWANARLYKMAGTLPEEQYRKDVGVNFMSLHGMLNHLLATDRIWMRRLTGTGDYPSTPGVIVCADLPALTAARREEDERIINFVQSLTEMQFEELWDYQTLNGTPQKQCRRQILAHMFNHQTHHRAQAHTILILLGIREPDPLDLLIMQLERK